MFELSSWRWGRAVLVTWLLVTAAAILADDATSAPIDATTLRGKVLCGYQGWFRCPGDSADQGWRHWSRDGRHINPDTLTVEMWPDVSEYSTTYEAAGFTLPGGETARLFSSVDADTVDVHFDWMRDYGIDGVFLQRFLVNVDDPSYDTVLSHARAAAARTGRAYALCYDLSGTPADRIVERLTTDWRRLVDELGVTNDDRYLRHNGKPVLFVWGFFSDRFPAEVAHRLIDALQEHGPCDITLVGGCQWYWRREEHPEWARAFRRLDVISPWNVGNVAEGFGIKQAATGYWREDLAEARRAGREYLPVIYPGFGWTNLQGEDSARHTIPRRGGEFYWRQFVAARDLEIDMAYVAMFDEVDEATAIFKVTNSPPTQARFQTYEDLPGDWYLQLTGRGTRLLRGDEDIGPEFPGAAPE
jgi:hypothetical protein